jgi:GT2 family glycosyltransferase
MKTIENVIWRGGKVSLEEWEKVPLVYVIIVNFNGLEYTRRCLESLKRVKYPNFKTVVIDNGSERLESEILKELFPDLIGTIRLKNNIGFAGGNNVGISYAFKEGADYFFLLNNDTVVSPDVLKELIVFANKDPKIGIVGPKVFVLLNGKRTNLVQSFGAKVNLYLGETPLIGGQVDQGQFEEPLSVDYVSGCAMLVKRDVIGDLGFLDPRYFMYVEEVDYCLRAKRRGFQTWTVPKARIWHKGEASATDLQRLHHRISSLIIFERIHAPKLGLITFILYFLFVKTPILSARLFLKKPLDTIVTLIKAFRNGFSTI